MRNCSLDQSAERIIAQLATLLDDERIRREIDEPVDRVLETFSLDSEAPPSQEFFNRTIGRFVREIYLDGLRLRRELSHLESVAEAIFILKDYQGQGTAGYDVAVYVALHEHHDGIQHILKWIADMVKKTERHVYIQWVLGTSWNASDWTTKYQVTGFLVDSLAPFLPKTLLAKPIAQLAKDWEDVLTLYLSSETLLEYLEQKRRVFSGI